jgi:hypothetical protein
MRGKRGHTYMRTRAAPLSLMSRSMQHHMNEHLPCGLPADLDSVVSSTGRNNAAGSSIYPAAAPHYL